MDPFSITAGVITVVDFSGKVIAACSTYISTLKDAPNELFLIRAEVASLRDIVRTLDLPQGPGLPAAGNTRINNGLIALKAPGGTLARCEAALKGLLELLVPGAAKGALGTPGMGQASKQPSRLHKFAAFRLASLLSSKHTRGSQNQKLYDDLGWSAFDLASWPSKQKKAKALLGEIMQHKTTIILALEAESWQSLGAVIQRVDKLHVQQTQAQAQAQAQAGREVKANVLRWLSAPDVTTKHSSIVAGRFPGTCGWVFGHDSYVKWSTQGGILWMIGIAGYGKSTLVSSIIQQLQIVSPGKHQELAYFYFDKDKKDMTEPLDFLRAVVAQLIQKSDMTEAEFVNVFGPDGVAARESFQAATPELLESVVTALAATKKVALVVDAVDECEDTKTLLALVARLVRTNSVDILMSSRPSVPIKKAWAQLAMAHPRACHELALTPSMNKGDITVYVTQTVESMVSSKDLSLRDPRLREEIIGALKGRSNGMFQWAASHLRCLAAYCTDYDISEALKELPQGLDKTYEHMIKQLTSSTPTRNMRLCRRVFQMLLFAHRPLTLPELAVAISIEPESKNLDTSTILNDPQSVLALGGPLVVYQPETNLVQFSHHTVREYLVSLGADAGAFHFIQADSHAEITRTCLCYIQSTPVLERLRTMSFSDLQAGESGGEGDVAFVHYAAKYWIGHAQQTTTTVGKDMLANLLYNFFFAPSQERPFHVWQAVAEPPWDAWEKGRQPARLVAELTQRAAASAPMAMMPAMSALGNLLMARQRAAASATAPLHLQRHWERLPKINFLPSSAGGERRIAPLHQFHYLARINHPECLSRILSYGGPILGRITATGGPLATTTLDEAAKHGALEFLEVLFNAWNGQVDVNSTDMLGRTALFYASQSGSVGVVQLLLQHGAEVIRSDWYGSTPFHEAVIRGHHAVVECLLSASKANLAVLDFVDLSDETPLAKAGRSSDSEMVRLLVRHCSGHAILGAVRAFLRSGTSPGVLQTIMGACSERTWDTGEAPLQELVQEGAERHLYGVHPGNPTRLHVLNMLVDNGYPVDLEDSKRDTALGYALDDGQENMSLALLDRGAQLPKALRGDLSPRRMGAAFIKAVDRGGFKLALLLLSRGAAWDVEDQWGRGFIDVWAAQVTVARPEYVPGYAPLGIVEATTATSAVEDPIGTAALQLLKGVLERGMDINATNAQGRSLLHLLCSSLCGWNGEGIPELRWILSRGGNASLRDNQSMTPLHCLCANAQARWTEELGRVVGLLTEPVKNSINACVLSSGTPLHMLVESSFGSGRLPDFVMYALDQLLEAGASREAWNSRGETPLVIALAALLKDPQWSRRNSHGLLSAASRLASPDKEENRLPSDSGDQIIQGLLATFGGDDLSLAFLLGNLNLTPPQTVLALGRTTNIRALEILIEGGANVRCRDDSGRTPLHMQVWRRGENLCGRLKVLLEAGADPNALDKGGKSVMDMLRGTISEARARGVGKTDVEELLLRYGARKLEIKVEASHGGWTRVDGRWVKTD